MKTYAVEMCRTSYIMVTVEAKDADDAEEKAWAEIENGRTDIDDAAWEITMLEEVKSTKGETK